MSVLITAVSILFISENIIGFFFLRQTPGKRGLDMSQSDGLRHLLASVENRTILAAVCFGMAFWWALLWIPETGFEKWFRIFFVLISGVAAMLSHLMKDFILHEIQTRRNALGGQ